MFMNTNIPREGVRTVQLPQVELLKFLHCIYYLLTHDLYPFSREKSLVWWAMVNSTPTQTRISCTNMVSGQKKQFENRCLGVSFLTWPEVLLLLFCLRPWMLILVRLKYKNILKNSGWSLFVLLIFCIDFGCTESFTLLYSNVGSEEEHVIVLNEKADLQEMKNKAG